MGTGLIFAAVIAIWVAYGVPLLLRRHEEATRGGGVTSFSGALRVLTQRKEEAVTGEPVEPVEVPEPVPTDPAPAASEPATTKAETPPRPYNRRAARVAARRRRRVLLTLLASCAIVGGLSVAGTLLPWAAAVPAGLVAVWLVLCRVMVRSEIGRPVRLLRTEGRAERRAARAARRVERRAVVEREGEGALVDTDREATMVISGQYEDHDPHRRNVMEKGPLPEGALDQQIVNAAAMTTTVGVTLWDPVPVTLPTYVTKPAAPRTVRTIDFGEPAAAEGRAQSDSEDGHGESRRAVGD
ncbi:hypothetical protein [Mumia zhuanghuii]|uniref:Uncharacterized protein n=1 Tax=Mumia zhuanghuii TaxID=2585211 RepID=A0A5C4MNQ8_9ACTN|nr:hypothetical protein [Mumia zhuanghuii]TNC43092.1 hypothetical protein FHE65_19165 [Mumia zhuanghuii]TNC46041.1 hypothetical protein FHE65_13895 [Mumia zhuanghuii]